MRSEPNDCIHALILGDLEHGDSDDDNGSNFPLFIKEASSPDDTFKILNASFHGKGKGGFAQICAHRRQPDPCLILDSPSYRRNNKNQGKYVSFQKKINHTQA